MLWGDTYQLKKCDETPKVTIAKVTCFGSHPNFFGFFSASRQPAQKYKQKKHQMSEKSKKSDITLLRIDNALGNWPQHVLSRTWFFFIGYYDTKIDMKATRKIHYLCDISIKREGRGGSNGGPEGRSLYCLNLAGRLRDGYYSQIWRVGGGMFDLIPM